MIARLALLPTLLLAACASGKADCVAVETTGPAPSASSWRERASEADRDRLRQWRRAFVEARDQAIAGGYGDALAAEGAIVDPDAALPYEDIAPGDYHCRTLKIGDQGRGTLPFVAYPAFACRIEATQDGALRFVKLTGSQRPIGRLYADNGERRIFLGTLQLGDEQRAFAYGQDSERDMAGIVETIGERRWRLILPYPHFESTIDIIELIPGGS